MSEPLISLILGGARSGKSAYAEKYASSLCDMPLYLATAQPNDLEMTQRIAEHQARRNQNWLLVEEPLNIVGTIQAAGAGRTILVECLTLWLANLMHAERNIPDSISELVAGLDQTRANVVLVANEVGLSIVPDHPLSRKFRDHAGNLNLHVAAVAHDVVFVAAGLPLFLKRAGKALYE
jgi:adenosylcobinamide kinase/adenosylcobinamide-phosphate guanylyltransferase